MLIFVRSSATEGSRFAVGRLGHGGSFRSVALKRSAGVEVEPACLWFQPLARLRPFESCGRCHHMRSWPTPSEVAYFDCVGRSAGRQVGMAQRLAPLEHRERRDPRVRDPQQRGLYAQGRARVAKAKV